MLNLHLAAAGRLFLAPPPAQAGGPKRRRERRGRPGGTYKTPQTLRRAQGGNRRRRKERDRKGEPGGTLAAVDPLTSRGSFTHRHPGAQIPRSLPQMSEQEAAPAAPSEAAPSEEPASAPAAPGPDATATATAAAAAAAAAVEAPAPPAPPAAQSAPPAAPAKKKPKEGTPNAPLNLTVDDVNDNSVTLTWDAPEVVGHSGLDGYVVEYCKYGTTDWVAANTKPFLSTRYVIRDLTSGDKLLIRVKSVKGDGVSEPAVLDQPLLIREVLEQPKIRLPRYLRDLYMKTVGDVLNMMIPFRGKPKPQVTWTKDGQPLDPKRMHVRNSERDSVLFIRQVQRNDSGKYEISVKILDELEDKATINLQVIERPGPPENLKLVDVWGFNVALEWSPPKDNGNADLKGYTVQKADKKTGQWFTVMEHYNRTNCTVSDLIIGNSYSFRVFSENPCGLSEKPAASKDVAHIKKSAITYKAEKYNSKDRSEPPKFTQPLTDRTTTRGYSTQLVCCVRGFPKPKVIWMKNKMEIGEDPRYLALMNQGVCSLEIRKPSPFDGGVYTCKAVNPLGEASVDCKLNVTVPE